MDSKNLTRETIFRDASKQLRSEFEGLRLTVPHSGLKGEEAEQLLRRFLDDHMPRRFATGAGFIMDRRDTVSDQTDVVIYDAVNCPVYRVSDRAGIFPADNVAATVEAKSDLDGSQFRDAAKKIARTKSLVKNKPPDALPLLSQTHCSIFAFSTSTKLETLAKVYREILIEEGLGRHPDLVAVLDQGLLSLVGTPAGADGWGMMFYEGSGGAAAEGVHIGVGLQRLGEDTLDVFFRLLLGQLSLFRGVVDHPGFGAGKLASGGKIEIEYLTTICHETDEVKKKAKLATYREDVLRMFRKT